MNVFDQSNFHILQWLFPAVITIHNLEEAVWLPGWSADAGKWSRLIDKSEFRFAVIVLTLLAYLVTYWSIARGPQSTALYLFCGYCWAMLINSIIPHLVVSLSLKRYMPGLASAVLLVIPVTVVLLWKALEFGNISFLKLLLISVPVIVGFLLLIRILFRIARRIKGN